MESANLDSNAPVGRDKIVTGDITGSNIAIGAGAQSIVNYFIKQALSSAEEARQRQDFAKEELGNAVARYATVLLKQWEQKTQPPTQKPNCGRPFSVCPKTKKITKAKMSLRD